MKQAIGDLWRYGGDVVVITTNGAINSQGKAVMGKGCAREARDMCRGIDLRLGKLIRQYDNRPFRLGQWPIHGPESTAEVVSMPVKDDWRDDADPELIAQSAEMLVQMADKFGWQDVVMPRPGCGSGNLEWDDIEELLAPILDDRFTVITNTP